MRTIVLVLIVLAILLVAQTKAGHKHFIKGLILGRILGGRHHHRKSHHHHHYKLDDDYDHHQYPKHNHVSNFILPSLPNCVLAHSYEPYHHNFEDRSHYDSSYGQHSDYSDHYDGGHGLEHDVHTGYGDEIHDQKYDEHSDDDSGHAS